MSTSTNSVPSSIFVPVLHPYLPQSVSSVFAGPHQTFVILSPSRVLFAGLHINNKETPVSSINVLRSEKPLKESLKTSSLFTELATLSPLGISNVLCSNTHALGFSSASREVYVWGSGSSGQLGLGSLCDEPVPRMVEILREAREEAGVKAEMFALGSKCTIGLFECKEEIEESGKKLLFWGEGKWLGGSAGEIAEEGGIVREPHEVGIGDWGGQRMEKVYANGGYAMVVTGGGAVLAWGSNDFGRLGVGGNGNEKGEGNPFIKKRSVVKRRNKVRFERLPKPVVFPEKAVVEKLALGLNHVLAIATDGTAYSWGQGVLGQLGTGNNENISFPSRVLFQSKLKEIACGDTHSLCIDIRGDVYAWGYGGSGQLGLGSQIAAPLPSKVDKITTKCTALACGSRHSLIISESKELFVFGDNSFGQLGLSGGSSGEEEEEVGSNEGGIVIKVPSGSIHPRTSESLSQYNNGYEETPRAGSNHTMQETMSELEFLRRRVAELESQNEAGRIRHEEETIFERASHFLNGLDETISSETKKGSFLKSLPKIDQMHSDFKKEMIQKTSNYHDNCSPSLWFALNMVSKIIAGAKENIQLKQKIKGFSKNY